MRVLSVAAIVLTVASSASAFVAPAALPQQQRAPGRTRGVVSTRLPACCAGWPVSISIGQIVGGGDRPARSESFTPPSSRHPPRHTQVQAGLFDGLFGNGGPSQADLEKEEAYRCVRGCEREPALVFVRAC